MQSLLTSVGAQVRHDGYTKQQKKDSMRGTRRFTAPSFVKWAAHAVHGAGLGPSDASCSALAACRTLYQHESGKQVAAGLYFVPMAAQMTKTIGKFTFKSGAAESKGPGLGGKVFSAITKLLNALGLLHILGSGIVDQVWPVKQTL